VHTSRFGAICPLWQALVPFLNATKSKHLQQRGVVVIDAQINQLKHVGMSEKVMEKDY
jgi:hypothetical protein